MGGQQKGGGREGGQRKGGTMQGRVGGSLATTQIGSLATIGSLGPIRITWHHGHRITWPHQDHRLLACTHAGPFWWCGGWGGGGGGGVGGMITYLGLHTDTPKRGLAYRLWACTHAGPFWWVGVGWVG